MNNQYSRLNAFNFGGSSPQNNANPNRYGNNMPYVNNGLTNFNNGGFHTPVNNGQQMYTPMANNVGNQSLANNFNFGAVPPNMSVEDTNYAKHMSFQPAEAQRAYVNQGNEFNGVLQSSQGNGYNFNDINNINSFGVSRQTSDQFPAQTPDTQYNNLEQYSNIAPAPELKFNTSFTDGSASCVGTGNNNNNNNNGNQQGFWGSATVGDAVKLGGTYLQADLGYKQLAMGREQFNFQKQAYYDRKRIADEEYEALKRRRREG